MDAFGYLSVLISIVLGLAITELLQGVRSVLLARDHVRLFGPTMAWAGLLLLIDTQAWWAMFGMRLRSTWTFADFVMVLLETILLYLLAGFVFPHISAELRLDLREHYFRHRRWFFGLAVVLLIVSVSKDYVLDGHLPSTTNLAFHAGFLVLWGTAALTARAWYHATLPVAMAVAFSLYIVFLFARL
jgi:hypothetical protein